MTYYDLNAESCLISAVFKGDVEEVTQLINNKVDVNYQSSNGRLTALHAAAHCCEYRNKNLNILETNYFENDDNDADDYNDNYIEILKILLKSGARINSKDGKNLTPLHYACRSNSDEAVRILLNHSADINARDKNWQCPLHICAMYNSVESARLILPLMSNIDVSDKQGRSALSKASFHGNLQMVEFLLENGANSNTCDKQERRPLHWASYVGYNEIIKLLLKHGADINCLDKELFTPILVAAASGKSEETINLLIENGANHDANTINDSSIFHLACLNGHDLIVKELLYKHKLTMKVNNKGFHPIHYSAANKLGAFCLELLVSLDIDVNQTSYDGSTAMHMAAFHGRTSCAQILYSNGALVNLKNNNNNTPLHLAGLNGHTCMMSFLIECGANIYTCGQYGMNAWALATLNGHYDCFKLIDQIIPTISGRKQFYESKDDFGRTFMHLAAICGNYECLHLFLKSDCNLNEIDESGNNPLHYACVGSHLRCVELLVRSGVEVNEVNKSMKHYTPLMDITILNKNNESILKMISSNLNPHGSTPLMLACAFDSDGCLVRELVFRSNARADLCDTYGYNVLHYAAFQGNINVFEILLDKCKHLDHQYNEKSISPIHILAYYGHREALEFLLKHLTDVNVQDKSGRTPIDYACFRGETSCVESLILHNANIDLFKDSLTGRTALHAAALNNNDECLKIISLIVNSKATTTTLDSSVTYLNEAYDYDLLTSNNTNCFYNSKLANLTDDMERTPLMIAVEQGHFNTINFLVNQMGADIFACDKKKRTALHRAAALGYEECCVVMLKSNFDCLMQRDLNGLLPIHYAIIAGHANLLFVFFEYYEKYLNENETNDKLLDLNGFSLLHISCFNGHSTCTETICDLSENYSFLIEMLITNEIAKYSTPLHMAIFNNHEQCVEILLDKFKTNANNYKLLIELKDQYENRPLHVAAMNNQYYVASLLIEADCVLNERNKRGHTPFMLAAAFNSFNIMELLLKKVAIKNDLLESIDFKGNSVLHLALLNNHENCALFILDKIENEKLINLQNKQGQTALHLAAKKGFTTVVEILLSKGANIWLQNKQKQTPLICCAKNEQVGECLNLMISLLMSNKLQNEQTNSIIKNDKTNPITMMMLMINQTNNNNNNNNENNNINIDNSIQKSSTKIINKNNLNSTLILNDNNTNTSSNGTRSTASSNEQIDTNLINNINNEMEEQEQEGELIEDYDDEDEDEEGEIVRVNNLDNIINYDKNDKLIELVQSKTLPLPLNNNKDDSSLFDSDFF